MLTACTSQSKPENSTNTSIDTYNDADSSQTQQQSNNASQSGNSQSATQPKAADTSIQLTEQEKAMKKATIETNLGKIVIEFYPQDAPNTVENFKKLAKQGFYNNVIFHRVIKGFMIQGGDPTGTGTGGPGYKFNDEINKDSEIYKTGYKKGVVAMANAGPNTNGSQFFIMHSDYPLPPSYTIFGHVIEGQDVVDKIATTQTDANDKPTTPVVMQSVTIQE